MDEPAQQPAEPKRRKYSAGQLFLGGLVILCCSGLFWQVCTEKPPPPPNTETTPTRLYEETLAMHDAGSSYVSPENLVAYRSSLDLLEQKCPESRRDIALQVEAAGKMVEDKGLSVDNPRLTVMFFMNQLHDEAPPGSIPDCHSAALFAVIDIEAVEAQKL